MIVHFIGGAGTGKSTLLDLAADAGGFRVTPIGFKRFFTPAGWLLPVVFPLSLPLGKRLVMHNRNKAKGPGGHSWTATIAMQRARKWMCSRGTVHLVDHAMTNELRKHSSDSAAMLVDSLPLPDMVVHISTPQAVRAARVALRQKPSHVPGRYFTSDQARERARRHARRWSYLWGPEEAMRCLRAWNRWQCRPQLDDNELAALLREAQEMPLTQQDEAAIQCEPLTDQVKWLHDAFVAQGVHWLNIINDGHESAEFHADHICHEINRCLR
jgi:hypothetical protein